MASKVLAYASVKAFHSCGYHVFQLARMKRLGLASTDLQLRTIQVNDELEPDNPCIYANYSSDNMYECISVLIRVGEKEGLY